MNIAPICSVEFELIRWLQSLGSPHLDGLFKALNFVDTAEFNFVLISILSIAYRSQLGMRLLFVLVLSAFTNDLLKECFQAPRPFAIDPTLSLIKVSGYSFPSGAAQSAVIYTTVIVQECQSKAGSLLAAASFLLLSFSRVYLGVHFPSDIVAGWIVGGVLSLVYLRFIPLFEKKLKHHHLVIVLLGVLLASLGVYSLKASDKMVAFIGFFMGGTLASQIALKRDWLFDKPCSIYEFSWRLLYAIVGMGLLVFALKALGHGLPIQLFAAAFIIATWPCLLAYGIQVGLAYFLESARVKREN